MTSEFANAIIVPVCLMTGAVVIAVFVGWMLRFFDQVSQHLTRNPALKKGSSKAIEQGP